MLRAPSSRRARRWVFVVVAAVSAAAAAWAHDPFTSWTNAWIGPERITLEVALARNSALLLLPGGDKLPTITTENFESFRGPLTTAGATLFEVTAAGVPLGARVEYVRIIGEDDDIEFRCSYPRPASGPVRFTGLYLDYMVDDHVGTLVVRNDKKQDLGWEPLSLQTPSLELPLPQVGTSTTADIPRVVHAPSFWRFLKLGVQHILAGFDHLLFLGALLVACRRIRSMVVIITCFTVAHSITLALAVLDIFSVQAGVIEPLIAASIIFVGVENVLRRKGEEPRGRGWLTFCFGLIHGFGFAGALKAIGIGQNGSSLVVPLFSFNLGVELGQIAVAAVALPVLLLLRRYRGFATYGAPALSLLIAAAGAYWLIERTIGNS